MASQPHPTIPPETDAELADAIKAGWGRPVPSLRLEDTAPPGLKLEDSAPSIAELIAVIGEEATQLLCQRLGGISREVGKPSAEFVLAIGEEKALKLKEYWGRGRLYIPRHAMSYAARHARIRDLAKGGRTRQDIARTMGISERQVYKVLAAAKPAAKISA